MVTALLLFGQFAQLRSAPLLALAGGYLFDFLIIIPHALTFPGLFSPSGLLGASGQTTAWLYMFWHGGFPIFVMAYAALERRDKRGDRARVGRPGARRAVAVILAVGTVVGMLTSWPRGRHQALPEIMEGNGYTTAMKFVVSAVWALSALALLVLLSKRPLYSLDLWLIVVMSAWLFDIALSAVFNAERFDLGFYAGRAYGLVAATFVLAGILLETSGLHSRLAAATAQIEDHARRLDQRVRERTDELHRANRELSAIIEASPVAIYMLDQDGVVMLWNASAERVFGYTEEEAVGKLPLYLLEDQLGDFQSNIGRAVTGDVATGSLETQRGRKDGKIIDVLVRWARVNDETGHILGIMHAAADITEHKKLESQLQHSQKMEVIGNLTGGMAHDFNNLLAIIIGNLDVLRDRRMAVSALDLDELAREALDAALRGADLTRRLLAFARRQPLQPARVDINELIAGISKLLDRTLGKEIEITLELSILAKIS